MNLLDMRTVLSSYVISSLISAAVMASLWKQNRKRSPELAFWLADFFMQLVGVLLIVLRGYLPDFFTMVFSNTLIVGGTLVLLIGLERYTSKPGPQWFNYIFVGVFFLVHVYFVYFQNSLQARTINNSVGILVMCGQCAWLLLRRVDPVSRPGTRPVGVVFGLFSLVSLVRIFVDLSAPQGNDLFKSGLYDTLGVLTYQMLYVSLTFTLVLMVNRRLFTALENDITERKMAEAALKISEEKFSVAFHNSPDAIVISSLPDGKIIDANESFFRITEFSKEESLGRTTIELGLWGTLDHRQEFLEALQKQHRILNFETDFRKKSGTLFKGLISGEPVQLQGQISVLSVIHDITERKLAEEALRQSEAEMRALFASMHDVVLVIDREGVYRKIAPTNPELLVKPPEELLGNTLQDVFPPELAETFINAIQKVLDTKQTMLIEYDLIISDKTVRFEATIAPMTEDSTLWVAHDITRRQQTEDALRLISTRQEAILSSIPDIIMEVNNNKVYTWANNVGMEFFGEEAIGKEAAFYFEGEQTTYKDVQPLFEGSDELIYIESWQRRKDGEKRLLAWWCRTLKDPEGNVTGALSTARDITKSKRFELVQNAIFRITQAAITSEGIDALYHSIHSILGELIRTQNFYIALYDPVKESINFPYYVDQYDEPPIGITQVQGLTGYVIRTGRSLLATREIFDRLVQQGELEPVGTVGVEWMGAPLKVEGRMMGVIAVQSYMEGIHFNQEDLNLLEFVSTQVAQAIERKRMEEEIISLSLTDELTGLYNRRGFTLLTEQEMRLAVRIKRSMLLVFGDVDDLKAINDTHGHAQGDQALIDMAAILKETFREADILARFGGDEFLILAVDAAQESAESITNRIQAKLEKRNQQGDWPYQLNLSIGIARFDPEIPCTVKELIARADSLMYQQKQTGQGKK